MNWYTIVIFYIGIFDAGVLMMGGMVTAGAIMIGVKADMLWERMWPATGILVVSNFGAALVLTAVRWLVGA